MTLEAPPAPTTPSLPRLFAAHAGGVAVVTADAGHGPAGFTATSVSSLSLDPPLLVFNVSSTSSNWDAVASAPTAAVHFLDASQADLARRFSTRGADRFAAPLAWSPLPGGAPGLDEAPVVITGPVEHRFAAGDHHLVVLRIAWAQVRRPHSPLLHHAGGYHRLGTGAPEGLTAAAVTA
ncbi:flavin reductase family protein [Kineococcus sp. SYSU DK005]|uniref:flavin reductase family protein n=1 Tax=Kineococcus sp. SYSU DK005 TaxID=3383126 RepID=UPI003D7CF8F5